MIRYWASACLYIAQDGSDPPLSKVKSMARGRESNLHRLKPNISDVCWQTSEMTNTFLSD